MRRHRRNAFVSIALTLGSTLACGTQGPHPSVTAVTPSSGLNAAAVPITIVGDGFAPMPVGVSGSGEVAVPKVFLVGGAGAIEIPATFVSTGEIDAVVPAAVAVGVYAVRVENANGKSGEISGGYQALLPDSLVVGSVSPDLGWTGEDTAIVVAGSGFASTPRIDLLSGTTPVAPLTSVAYLDSSSLIAIVPAGIAPGTYDLRVTNPAGEIGTRAAAFTVGSAPFPRIDSVAPDHGPAALASAVTIAGANFPGSVEIAVVDSAGTASAASVSLSSATAVDATIPALPAAAYRLVARRPSDGATGSFAPWIATGPDGAPGPWLVESSALEPRRSQGLAAATDDAGRAFLYQVGGEAINAGTTLTTYDTVEVAPLDDLGYPGPWRLDDSKMGARRSGPAVWAFGGYLFAAGGRDATPAILGTVERARILRQAGAPRSLSAATDAAGSLAAGSWYYRVSAVVSDADDPGGESLPGGFVTATLAAPGKVTLSWTAPAEGAVASYDVYRTPAPGGALGQERLLASGVSGTSFVDDGTLAAGTQAPKAPGSLGKWVTLPTGLMTPRADAGVAISRAPLPGGAAYGASWVYVVGGTSTTSATGAPLASYERSVLSTTGAISFAGDAVNVLATARMRPATGVGDASTAPGSIPVGRAYVYAEGGLDPSTTGVARFPRSVEAATVGSSGVLTWQSALATGVRGAGAGGLMIDRYLWIIGGEGLAGVTASVSTGLVSSGAPPALTGMSATASLPAPRSRAGVTVFRGRIYVVGGSNNGTDTVRSVFDAVY